MSTVSTELNQFYDCLSQLVTSHRQLLDLVRREKEVLVSANLEAIQKVVLEKEVLVTSIHQLEQERKQFIERLARTWNKPIEELNLEMIILEVQALSRDLAEKFRSVWNALKVLLNRILSQNSENRALVENSLSHLRQMRQNTLSELEQFSKTYNPKGVSVAKTSEARLISQEA